MEKSPVSRIDKLERQMDILERQIGKWGIFERQIDKLERQMDILERQIGKWFERQMDILERKIGK